MAAQLGGKTPSNIRLTPGGKMLLVQLADQMGLTQSGVMETAIRLLAKEQGLKPLHISSAELAAKLESLSDTENAVIRDEAIRWARGKE